jgi:hypothetical protein
MKDWEKDLTRKIKKSQVAHERYATDAPSRRMEGAWGADIEPSGFSQVTSLIQGSADLSQFEPGFEFIKRLFTRPPYRYQNPVSQIVFFGDDEPRIKRKTCNFTKYRRCIDEGRIDTKQVDINEAIRALKTIHKHELILLYTDGNFDTALNPELTDYWKRQLKKLIWIVPPDYKEANIETVDYRYRQRIIVLD